MLFWSLTHAEHVGECHAAWASLRDTFKVQVPIRRYVALLLYSSDAPSPRLPRHPIPQLTVDKVGVAWRGRWISDTLDPHRAIVQSFSVSAGASIYLLCRKEILCIPSVQLPRSRLMSSLADISLPMRIPCSSVIQPNASQESVPNKAVYDMVSDP